MIFTEQNILDLIASGEGPGIEFKRDISQRSDLAGELIAFANTSGGTLLVGVEDNGEIAGVSDADATMTALANISRNNCRPALYPLIELVFVKGKAIFAVKIDPQKGPPFENNSGQCYVRVGNTKQLASPEQRARLLQRSGLYHFDETPVWGTTREALDDSRFQEYFESVSGQKIATSGPTEAQILEATRVMTTDLEGITRMTVAGLLIFGHEPQLFLPQSRVTVVRYLGDDSGADRLNPQELEGTLPELIQQAGAYALQYTGVYSRIEGFKRADTPLYPISALREAMTNAVAHRDYSRSGSQVRLFIFDNWMEIRSPGGLPNALTLESIRYYNHEARNPLLAQFLRRLGFMEEFGTGIPTMIRLMREHAGREPEFAIEGEEFVVRLYAKKM